MTRYINGYTVSKVKDFDTLNDQGFKALFERYRQDFATIHPCDFDYMNKRQKKQLLCNLENVLKAYGTFKTF